ncbi:MAG: restriction endonuclease [Candidatus Methanomethylicia archaeon]
MSRSYVKGRRFEHYIKDKLEAKGWIVTRSAGSKGPFDLLAVKNGKILLIQCKWRRNTIAKNLIDVALKAGGLPVLATHIKGRVVFLNVNDESQIEI